MNTDLEASSKVNHSQVSSNVLTVDQIVEICSRKKVNDQPHSICHQSTDGINVEHNSLQSKKSIFSSVDESIDVKSSGELNPMDIVMMEFYDVSTSYHTECSAKNSFLYLMDHQHQEYIEGDYPRRQWRGICIDPAQEHLIEQFLDVSTNIRLLDVHASGSGYFVRWWLYRNTQGRFFLVNSTSVRDICFHRCDRWKFTFYEYTESQIRGVFLNDKRYQREAMDAIIGNNCISRFRKIPKIPLDRLTGSLSSINRCIDKHSSSSEDLVTSRPEGCLLSGSKSTQVSSDYEYNGFEIDDYIENGYPFYALGSEEFQQTAKK